jgi:hypothetical protein
MIRFQLTFPEAPSLIGDSYETIDEANVHADHYRRRGVRVVVETTDETEIERAIDSVISEVRRTVRPIRWARTVSVRA